MQSIEAHNRMHDPDYADRIARRAKMAKLKRDLEAAGIA
jgi:hypothetical protein